MKIQVEILQSRKDPFDGFDVWDNIISTEVFETGTKTENIDSAKIKLNQLKSGLPSNQKIRVLEYNSDDNQPCKILFE